VTLAVEDAGAVTLVNSPRQMSPCSWALTAIAPLQGDLLPRSVFGNSARERKEKTKQPSLQLEEKIIPFKLRGSTAAGLCS